VRLRLPDVVPLLPGDRFVLRESGRGETIGGGEVLDIDPIVRASRAKPDRSVDRVIAERGWVDANELTLLTGETREPLVGRWVVEPDVLASQTAELAEPSLDERQRAIVGMLDDVAIDAGRAKPQGAAALGADHPLIAALDAAPFAPPTPAELDIDRSEVRELVRQGLVIEEDGLFFSASAVEQAAVTIAEMLAAKPDGVTVAEVREAFGTSRKYAMPLLARLDGTGVTRRRDDVRIAGPRLPEI